MFRPLKSSGSTAPAKFPVQHRTAVSIDPASSMTRFCGRDIACQRGERLVFAGLDFDLDAGEALVVTGPNGGGKSSLLRLLAGLLPPLSGIIAWGEEDIARDLHAHRRRLNYLGHLDAVKPALTVHENVAFWAAFHGVPDPARATAEALERIGLFALADLPGRLLSAGQRRRAALACVLAAPAPLWLLDEPTTALDSASIAALAEAIADHRAAGGRIIAATHADLELPGSRSLDIRIFAAGVPLAQDWMPA